MTVRVVVQQPGGQIPFIAQALNETVFPDVDAVMGNFRRITEHLRPRMRTGEACLTLVTTKDGRDWIRLPDGRAWRVMACIPNAVPASPAQCSNMTERIGRAFGEFHSHMKDLAAPPLRDTIHGFHDTPRRFAEFERAVRAGAPDRVKQAEPTIASLRQHRALAIDLLSPAAGLAVRIVHNDAKGENVLLHETSGEVLCVIDLDTVMSGVVAHDFGDMTRTMAFGAPEDDDDPAAIHVDIALFEGLARGYLHAAGRFLTRAEIESLITGGQVVTYEQALRFMADFLMGDLYYPVDDTAHNLRRARGQLLRLDCLRTAEDRLAEMVRDYATPK
jgi:hypothetical protein